MRHFFIWFALPSVIPCPDTESRFFSLPNITRDLAEHNTWYYFYRLRGPDGPRTHFSVWQKQNPTT